MTSTMMQAAAVTIRRVIVIWSFAWMKWPMRSPPQHRGIPGSPGMTHPMMPTMKRMPAAAISAMSSTPMP